MTLLELANDALSYSLAVAVPVLSGFLIRKLHVDTKSAEADAIRNLSATLGQAAQQGAGIARGMLATQGATVADNAIANVAMAAGTTFALSMYPRAVAATNLTPESMGKLVAAEFGNKLADDPAVSVAPPPAFAPAS